MDGWINLIANAGFPIAVASYLLIRFENKIDALSQSINTLSTVVMNGQKIQNQSKVDDKVA